MSVRGVTLLEALVVVALVLVLTGAVVLPAYRSFSAARAPTNAALTLAEDLSLLERAAQNGKANEGAVLIIVSTSPLAYLGYHGRPTHIDPNSVLGSLIVARSFPDVALVGGPIDSKTPLLFASNGSAQYLSGGIIEGQHQTVEFVLAHDAAGRSAKVDLNLFTGVVATQ